MKLKSFGCSFIYGSDLSDEKLRPFQHLASQLTWPALLAKNINFEYECYAKPGCGNLRILERIIQQSTNASQDELFVIGWTWVDRFDYYDIYDEKQYHYSNWKTILPGQSTKIADTYYRNFHAQYKDKFTTLVYIRTAIDLLQQKRIPFIMTNIDNLIFETDYHVAEAVLDLQSYVKPYISYFDNQTFLEWCRSKNFPISELNHPLDLAHKKAAELMQSQIKSSLDASNRLVYR